MAASRGNAFGRASGGSGPGWRSGLAWLGLSALIHGAALAALAPSLQKFRPSPPKEVAVRLLGSTEAPGRPPAGAPGVLPSPAPARPLPEAAPPAASLPPQSIPAPAPVRVAGLLSPQPLPPLLGRPARPSPPGPLQAGWRPTEPSLPAARVKSVVVREVSRAGAPLRAPRAAPVRTAGELPSPSPRRENGGPAGGELERLLALIRARIDAAKHYPGAARERGVQGTTYVRFGLRADGHLAFVGVQRSSGDSLLDEASVLAVRGAAPFPFVAQVLTVPIRYSLEE